MIDVENIFIRNQEKEILKGISLKVGAKETVGIVGKSGAGKSTLLYALMGEVAKGLSVSGNIKIDESMVIKDGKISNRKTLREVRKKIGHLNQDPAASLTPTMSIKNTLKELSVFKGKDFDMEAAHTLECFDLPYDKAFLKRTPSELSGGQKRRVALARTLLRRPKLLLLDEPTAGLDEETKEKVLLLLSTLIEELKTSVLLITHDFATLKRLVKKFYLLEDGELKNYQETEIKSVSPKIEVKESRGKVILQVKKLSSKAPGASRATFKDLSFELGEGEMLAITANSGGGKTTLIRTLLGLWERLDGEVWFKGKKLPPSFRDWEEKLRGGIGWVPQDPKTSFNSAVSLYKALERAKKSDCSISDALSLVGFDEAFIKGRYPYEFSGGELQRLAIARAILGGAELLLLDEVTSALDEKTRDEILALMLRLKKKCPIIISTHDDVVVSSCDRQVSL